MFKHSWKTTEIWNVLQDLVDDEKTITESAETYNITYSALFQAIRRVTGRRTVLSAVAEGFRRGMLR